MNKFKNLKRARNLLSKARVLFVGMEIVGLIGLTAALPEYSDEGLVMQCVFAAMIFAGMLGILLWAIVNLLYQWRTDCGKVIVDAKKTADWLSRAKWAFAGMVLTGGVGSAIPYVQENMEGLYRGCRLLLEAGWIGMAVWLVMLGVSKRLDRN